MPFYVPRLRFLWDRPLMRSMLAFAIPAMFTAISFFFLKLSDRFFLLHYQGIAVVGLYTVANSLSQPLYIVGMAFRMAWPQWHYAKLNEPEKHKRMVSRSSTYFMAFNGILLVLVGFYLPLVIHVLLNEKFWSVGPTTFVLTLSVALYNLYFIFWIGANVAKKNRLIPVITLVASGVNVGLNFLLVPTYGMWAAAWTTTIGFGILAVLVYFISNRWYPIPYEWRRLITLAVATALTLGAGWAIGLATGVSVHQPLGDLILGELAMTPALLVFPLVLWATRFFTPGERSKLPGGRRTRDRSARQAGGAGRGGRPRGRGRRPPARRPAASSARRPAPTGLTRGRPRGRAGGDGDRGRSGHRRGREHHAMKKLLVIANPYPPMASAGTTRVVRFLRHLPDEGWEPSVLTATATGPAAVPPGVRVARAAVPWPKQLLGGGRRSTKVNRWVAVPDPYFAWVGPAILKGREIFKRERFDVIFSSSPRASVHLVAAVLSEHADVPWLADYRDPWSTYQFRQYPTRGTQGGPRQARGVGAAAGPPP